MPIKKVSIEHSLKKCFLFGKALNTISEQAKKSVEGVLNMVTVKSGFTKYFLEYLSFQSWHNRITLHLTLVCVKKYFSKVFSFYLSFISELSVCPNCVNLDVV